MKQDTLTPRFVEFVPDFVASGVLYISLEYETAVHNCCCGCGHKVVTPISPTDWSLTFDGDTVSVSPSIGSWSLPCQSHYWINRNRITWAPQWTAEQIAAGRIRDRVAKNRFYGVESTTSVQPRTTQPGPASLISRFVRWLTS